MKLASWNLNHRAGSRFTPYYPESANAIASISADLVVLTEYCPKGSREGFSPELHEKFVSVLRDGGYEHSRLSVPSPERTNRVLIAAKEPFLPDSLPLPTFDHQFPSNLLAICFPANGLRLLGVRIPYYTAKHELPHLRSSWDWLEAAAVSLHDELAVIIGDLNVSLKSRAPRGGDHFRRILASGWARAEPQSGASFPMAKGGGTEIDHALCSRGVRLLTAEYVLAANGYCFAGSSDALSDHAVLVVDFSLK